MNLHEYQAKRLLARHGVRVPREVPCDSPAEADEAIDGLFAQGAEAVVVKAQIHAGGRGKGVFESGLEGGVQYCRQADEARDRARQMLGNMLVTRQTGPEGREVRTVLVARAERILREFYLSILLDRATGRPVLMACAEGGVDIEELAETRPEAILRESVDPAWGLMPYQARRVARHLGIPSPLLGRAATLLGGVWRTWWESDASLVEINPLCLVETGQGEREVAALDAKISIEDNALYRQKEIAALRDLREEAPLEIEAGRHHLNYIKLDGNIACLVNGAGLAMAAMDIIKHYGGSPANFLDVGGGASREQVTAAFRIIMSDRGVRGIMVNIFGGIMQCDVIADGIVAAVRETGLALPLVVRLEGNNVKRGKAILAESGLDIIRADTMAEAAERIVQAAGTA